MDGLVDFNEMGLGSIMDLVSGAHGPDSNPAFHPALLTPTFAIATWCLRRRLNLRGEDW